MQKPVKKDICLDSSDGHSKVTGFVFEPSGTEIFCVLQITHGMCEYIERYKEFVAALA